MNTTEIEKLYHKIANSLNETIPEEWDRILMYGEVLEGVSEAFFNYYPKGSNESVYSHDIPELFEMSNEDYNELWLQLLNNLEELHNFFKENGQEVWTNLTFILDSTGKFKIDYDYTDLSNVDDVERHIIWDYKYLGVEPEDEDDKKIIDEYIKNQEK
ncbi:MAG TPA: immunity protein YezG family protein [Clostridia bacterium]